MIRKLCLVSVIVLCLAAPSTASAYWPYLGYGGYGGYGYVWGFNQATNYVPSPPYYSIYPPVYYSSQITARSYGASPFAWAGGMSPITYAPQPEPAAAPEPMMIENPFFTGGKATSKPASAAIREAPPLKVANPFVVSR